MPAVKSDLRHQEKPRRVSSQLFRRASLDQINFQQPPQRSSPRSRHGPSRPSSAWSGPDQPQQLPNVSESRQEVNLSKHKKPYFFVRSSSDSKRNDGPRTPPRTQLALKQSISSIEQVPPRKSSTSFVRDTSDPGTARPAGKHKLPFLSTVETGRTIPLRGKAVSPVRRASQRSENLQTETVDKPFKTYRRRIAPLDIVEVPELKQPGFALNMQLASPVFTGGGTVEGSILAISDSGKPKARQGLFSSSSAIPNISLSRLTVDVLGVEMWREKKHIFQSLAMELVDEDHPPPVSMLSSSNSKGPDWNVAPSTTKMNFCLSLPVEMGPPPYKSRFAKIRYLVAVTATIKIGSRSCCVRTSREVDVITVQDPNTTLVNLPKPLVVSDSLRYTQNGRLHELELIAGVHRQNWVSGSPLYTDVLISNKTNKHMKKIGLTLAKVTLFQGDSAVTTDNSLEQTMRTPIKTQREVVARQCTKASSKTFRHGWLGTPPHSQDESTCMLEVPSGLVTVDTAQIFSVRYFLSIEIGFFGKRLTVQIPITIIHPNSLDIVPNSIAQVAKAIDSARKRSTSVNDRKAVNEIDNLSGDKKIARSRNEENFKHTQATPYAVARRKSLDQVVLETLKLPKRPRKAPPPLPLFNKPDHGLKIKYEPLNLSFPEPPRHRGDANASHFVPPRLKTRTPVKLSADLGLRSEDIQALTKELQSSPIFKKRKSQDKDSMTKDHKPPPSIMSRPRPWARTFYTEGQSSVQVEPIKGLWNDHTNSGCKHLFDCSTSGKNSANHAEFKPDHAFHHQPGELCFDKNHKSPDIAVLGYGNDWEDVDIYDMNGLGGGPGPDIGDNSIRLRVQSIKDGHLRLDSSSSNSSLIKRRRISYVPSNHARPARRSLVYGGSLASNDLDMKRRRGVYDYYHRRHSPVPKYHIRRSTGNMRYKLGKMQTRHASNNPFFHGSSRLVTSSKLSPCNRSFSESVTLPQTFNKRKSSGRGRSTSDSARWDRKHLYGMEFRKDGPKKLVSFEVEAETTSYPKGNRKSPEGQEVNYQDGSMVPEDVDFIESVNSSGSFQTPGDSPEIHTTSSRYSQPTASSQSTSLASLHDSNYRPSASDYIISAHQWHLQNQQFDHRQPSQSRFSETTTDYAEYLSSPSTTNKNDHADRKASVTVPFSPQTPPLDDRQQAKDRQFLSRTSGPQSPTQQARLNRDASQAEPKHESRNSRSSTRSSSSQNQRRPPRSSSFQSHQHFPSTSTSTTTSSRPPPSHPNSNILSPIAESVGNRTPRAKLGLLRPVQHNVNTETGPVLMEGETVHFSREIFQEQGSVALWSKDVSRASLKPAPLVPLRRETSRFSMVMGSRGSDNAELGAMKVVAGRRPGEKRVSKELGVESEDDRRKREEKARRRRLEWLSGLGFGDEGQNF